MTIILELPAQTDNFLQNHPEFAVLLSDYTYNRLQSTVQLRNETHITKEGVGLFGKP